MRMVQENVVRPVSLGSKESAHRRVFLLPVPTPPSSVIAGAEVRAAAATTQKLGQWINDAMIDATRQTMKQGLEKARAGMNECERHETKCKTLGRCLSILLDEGILDMTISKDSILGTIEADYSRRAMPTCDDEAMLQVLSHVQKMFKDTGYSLPLDEPQAVLDQLRRTLGTGESNFAKDDTLDTEIQAFMTKNANAVSGMDSGMCMLPEMLGTLHYAER